MNFRSFFAIWFATFVFSFVPAARSALAAPATEDLIRLHWLGLKQAGADSNSAPFMKVWQLPQTTALVAQTLDKLSRWPGCGATNAASTALRPLLDDLVSSEFYLELSAPTNSSLSAGGEGRGEVGSTNSALRPSPFALVLAVHLPADRANFWQTNLAAASAAWAAAGTPHRIECSRAGDWTLVCVGQKIAETDFAAHLSHTRAMSATNIWLETDFNPSMLADCFSLSAGGEGRGEVGTFSTFNLQPQPLTTLISPSFDSSNLLTRATLDLARPFANAAASMADSHQPHSRAAHQLCRRARHRRRGWPACRAWQKLQLAPAPDQACCWSQAGIPFQTYLAAPLPGASNQLLQLAGRLVPNANPWLATNAEGIFPGLPSLPGILWNDADHPHALSHQLRIRPSRLSARRPVSAFRSPMPPPAARLRPRRHPAPARSCVRRV